MTALRVEMSDGFQVRPQDVFSRVDRKHGMTRLEGGMADGFGGRLGGVFFGLIGDAA